MRRWPVALVLTLLALGAVAPAAGATGAATAPTKVVRIDKKQKVGYRSIGSGRPIGLVIGLGGNIDGWDPTFVDAVAATGHRVVIFDNEGIGRSTSLKGPL